MIPKYLLHLSVFLQWDGKHYSSWPPWCKFCRNVDTLYSLTVIYYRLKYNSEEINCNVNSIIKWQNIIHGSWQECQFIYIWNQKLVPVADGSRFDQPVLFVNISSLWSVKPPLPNPPEEETDEEKGLRRLFEQVAGSVRHNPQSNILYTRLAWCEAHDNSYHFNGNAALFWFHVQCWEILLDLMGMMGNVMVLMEATLL